MRLNYIEFKKKYSVTDNARKGSKLIRDELVPGKDVAAYWIEYVLPHGGTQHLQLASKNMPFYQRHLLDVGFLMGLITASVLVVVFKMTSMLRRSCLKGSKIKRN